MNKYEMLQDDKIEVDGHTLYRIKALRDFNDVKAGDLGGYIEREENLSQEGNCWVYGNARVFGNACVFGDAQVYGHTCVFGNAWVCDNARVYNNACVFDNARVFDNAYVFGNACIFGNARVYNNARVRGNAQINKNSDILCVSPIGSRNATTTFFKTKDGNICVKCGCFTGTIDKFLEAVGETHGENKHAKAYRLACELARVQIELEDKINE